MRFRSPVVILVLLGYCLARPKNIIDEIEELYTGMFEIVLQSRCRISMTKYEKRRFTFTRLYLGKVFLRRFFPNKLSRTMVVASCSVLKFQNFLERMILFN